jgi:hypothetical protein
MAEEYEALQLQKSDEVNKILDERHISDDEIKMTIYEAEKGGEKCYRQDDDHFLANKKTEKVTFNVEYSVSGDNTYTIHTAYAHRGQVD